MHLLLVEDDSPRRPRRAAARRRAASRRARRPARLRSSSPLAGDRRDRARRRPARPVRLRGRPPAARPGLGGADPHAHRARQRLGPSRRPRLRGGRLPRQAVRDRGGAARVRALGRRGRGAGAATTTLGAGPIQLDEATRIVTVDGLRVDLSPREFALLECLLRHRGGCSAATSSSTTPGRTTPRSRPRSSTPTSTSSAASWGRWRAARSRPSAAWATGQRRHERRDDDHAPHAPLDDARGPGPRRTRRRLIAWSAGSTSVASRLRPASPQPARRSSRRGRSR